MGATRLASEKMQLLFSRGRFTLLSLSRRETRLLKNAPMQGKGNCCKYLRISLKMNNFTSNNTL